MVHTEAHTVRSNNVAGFSEYLETLVMEWRRMISLFHTWKLLQFVSLPFGFYQIKFRKVSNIQYWRNILMPWLNWIYQSRLNCKRMLNDKSICSYKIIFKIPSFAIERNRCTFSLWRNSLGQNETKKMI